MKRLYAILIAFVLLLAMTGCKGNNSPEVLPAKDKIYYSGSSITYGLNEFSAKFIYTLEESDSASAFLRIYKGDNEVNTLWARIMDSGESELQFSLRDVEKLQWPLSGEDFESKIESDDIFGEDMLIKAYAAAESRLTQAGTNILVICFDKASGHDGTEVVTEGNIEKMIDLPSHDFTAVLTIEVSEG